MTKENFLKFKEDFKKSIEIVKIQKKFTKKWSNAGYDSEESYKNAENEANKKVDSLRSEMLRFGNSNFPIYAELPSTHWAYYCAKHRLNTDEIKNYLISEYNKMSESKRNEWVYMHLLTRWDSVRKILEAYGEEIVYSN